MKIKLYQIDAFTDTVFSGNPAAVCPLETWLDDTTQPIVIFNFFDFNANELSFQSRSGVLTVVRNREWYTLNFPVDTLKAIAVTDELIACIGKKPIEAFQRLSDAMLVFSTRQEIEEAVPDLLKITHLKARGLIVTAPGTDTDFVSRFFAPQFGINEDPVTGSAHTTLTPYWSRRLGKSELTARQISKRGGFLKCKVLGDRVEMSGQGAFYMEGEISI